MNLQKILNFIHYYQLVFLVKFSSFFLGGKSDVKLDKPLQKFNKIIEIASTNIRFASCCLNHESNNFLGLLIQDSCVNNEQNKNILAIDKSYSIKNNNADIIILSEKQLLQRLWFFNEYKHTQYILCAPSNFASLLSSLPGLLKNSFLKRIQVIGFLDLEDNWGIKQPTLMIEILKRVTPNARRYISPFLGVESFFEILSRKQVKYTILRWFEDLPTIMPGEDIDMLVADEDLEIIETLIQKQPGIIPCDIYTVSGLPGTAYKNMAYYPPLLARQILEGSITYKKHFRVPKPKIYFYSLAYHAIYHKGQKSGIPTSLNENTDSKLTLAPEHEYTDILSDLAKSLGIEVDITIESLDNFLNSINWRPSQDTLARLDSRNIWLKNKSQSTATTDEITDINGLAVFFIRQKALDLKLEQKIIELLTKEGFSLIETKILTPEEVKRVKYQVRGGNWGKGPWPESGGDPAMVLVAVDLMPLKPTDAELAKQPHLSNGRIAIKNQIRDVINQLLSAEQQFNTIHSSDNEREAWNYLQIAIPDKCTEVKHRIAALRHDFLTTYPIKQDLTRFAKRAKVELIEYQNQLAVKKTFRPGCEKFFKRELFVCQSFGQQYFAIPTLIYSGSNYLIYPYYDDLLLFQNRQSRLLPLSVAKQAIETLNFFYERGYAPIDFQPANIIVDRHDGFKIIDFEFLYKYKNRPGSLEECYELAGLPNDFDGDKPDFKLKLSYETRWKPYVGLNLKSLLYDPVWLQYIKRFFYGITHLPIRFLKNRFNALLSHYYLTIDRAQLEQKAKKSAKLINNTILKFR